MKVLLKKGSKRFSAGVIMAMLFFFIPTFFNFVVDSVRVSYYTNVSIDRIASDFHIQVEDICFGEREQLWLGTRTVNIPSGISANITRELYRIVETQQRGQIQAKIHEETKDIFIDPVSQNSRIQIYDKPLAIGEYVWQVKFNELRLPSGVIRTDLPFVRTNIFEVKECNYDPVQE